MNTPTPRRNIFLLLSILLFGVIFFFTEIQIVDAAVMENLKTSNPLIVEYIRLNVSSKNRRAWLIAEEKTWKPWLAEKEGFLNRELLWDKKQEEATLLIRWSTREKWKSIPKSEIDRVQEQFEKIARDLTGKQSGNPFPIIFEGEFLPQ
tara:strand:+ start:231 stop:677 length:447 start_codon:yes stop_codon:yes gene_type:complete